MNKTKVAFFADCLIENYDGAIRTMYEIINRIPTSQFEFLFVTGDVPKEVFQHRLLEIASIVLPVNNNYKVALSFLSGQKLDRTLNAFVPDVIHLSTPSPLGHVGLNYAKQNNIPVIAIYHTHFLSYISYYLQKWPLLISPARDYLISTMQRFYNRCDLVYVPTSEMIKNLRGIGVFSNHLKLWQRGLKEGLFSPCKGDAKYLQGITQNDKPNILFSSRLVWEKNLKTLINVYRRSEDSGLGYNFIIAGDGYARSAVQLEMPNAYFLGHLNHEELAVAYASSDVFLFPSISETYGNVVVEAMASGLPCVIGNGGGTRDLISHGKTGFLCEPNNPDAYLEVVGNLLTNKELYNRISNAALAVTAELSWESLSDTYFSDIQTMAMLPKSKRA